MRFMGPIGTLLYLKEPFTGIYPESHVFGCYIVFLYMYTYTHACIHPQKHYPAVISDFPSDISPWRDKPSFNSIT